MKTYRLYIDESGDPVYRKEDRRDCRYLGLLGVWFRRPEPYVAFAARLEKLKLDVFGPSPTGRPVILHRDCILRRRGVFGMLNDAAKAKQFDDGLLALVAEAQFRMACVVIDKASHSRRYNNPDHPYHFCIQAMLERYCFCANRDRAQGDAAAESRGKREDGLLRAAYRKFYTEGTRFVRVQEILTSADLAICPKTDNVAGLQLADILAKPAVDHCLANFGLSDPPPPSFGTRLLDATMSSFDRHRRTGKIDGYGRVLLSAPTWP